MQQWNSEKKRNCLQSIFLAINGEEANGAPSSLAVDCTLSLGTPSTRQLSAKTAQLAPANDYSLKLDLLPSPSRVTSRDNAGGDQPLVPRRCANCDTTSTPLWRNGPRGPKSLCNACGIRYKKEERRAASSAVNALASSSPSSSSASLPSSQQQQQHLPASYSYRQTWGCPWQHFDMRFRD